MAHATASSDLEKKRKTLERDRVPPTKESVPPERKNKIYFKKGFGAFNTPTTTQPYKKEEEEEKSQL